MNKHTITNCSTCSKGNKYGVVTENNGGEDSLNWSRKIYPKKWYSCRELKGKKELDLQSMGKNIPVLYGRPLDKQSLMFGKLKGNHTQWHGKTYC